MDAMDMARKIARAAGCLDDLRAAPVDGAVYWQSCRAAIEHIKNLHIIAFELAGDQASEIYAPDDEIKLNAVEAAGIIGAFVEEPCANT